MHIRLLTLDQIRSSVEINNPTEDQIDASIEKKCREVQSPSERRIDTWGAPDDFEPLICPQCRSQSVVLELLAII